MRGLTEARLDTAVGAILDARLAPASTRPLAMALSGGGDSVALTLMASDWAKRRGRRLLVLTVDHGLRPESADWTAACAALAQRLGADFRALAWTGEKPRHGLPAAARAARHALLADAAREAGASVILMGHTADDRAEAAAMRAEGSTTPDPREWAPSPAWPQGRSVFLLRPLLGLGRAELRDWLRARGETWIEDPANADPRFARARARLAGAGRAAPPLKAPSCAAAGLARQTAFEAGLSLPRAALREAEPQAARAFVAAAALCAAGGTRPPRGPALDRLMAALMGGTPVTATLAGASIVADADRIGWFREPGEMARAKLAPLALRPGEPQVWDGRYELAADRPLTLEPLAGRFRRLAPAARAALQRLPPRARGGLPAFEAGGRVICPVLEPDQGVSARPLSLPRLHAALGLVAREPT